MPLTIVDPNGVTTTLAYDGRLNLNTSTLADRRGQSVTTHGHTTRRTISRASRQPDNSKLTYGYDTAHRLTSITDLPGNSIDLYARRARRPNGDPCRKTLHPQ